MLRTVVDRVRRFRRSEGFKHSLAAPVRLSLHARQRLNRNVFAIEIRENSGFFSVMQMVLFILKHCEEKRLTPQISARGGLYGDPEGKIDWFSALFESVRASGDVKLPRRVRTSTVRDLVQLGLRQRHEAGLRLQSSSDLFRSHYRPVAAIRDEVDATCAKLDIGQSTLGVHYRGTDKKFEAMTLPWADFCRLVEQTLALNPHLTNIFVSSDEQAFIDFFRAWPFNRPVSVAPAKLLSTGDMPVHFSGYPGLEIGREALVSSLLLSKCGYLVKMPSYLSAWSKILNPDLPTTLAVPPKPDAFWFPDSQIWIEQEQVMDGKAA
ncbi:O-fucosyltransferase family protein [Caballeronia sp. HLA56]